MTMRGIRLALALALCVSLAAASSADASSHRLTRKEAKRMAVKLARKQVRRFDLRFYVLGHARRVGPRRIAFPYEARTRGNTYCKATLRVRKRTRGNRILLIARIGRQHCIHMPADALAVESATRKAQRAFRKKATRRSFIRYFERLTSCSNIHIPRSREEIADDVLITGLLHSIFDPNRAMFDKFAARLDAVDTTHVVLADGITGWLDFVDVVESLPRFQHPCTTLARWKRNGWTYKTAPIRARDFNAAMRRMDRALSAIDRAGRFLRGVGVYPKVATGFVNGGIGDFLGGDDVETDTIQARRLHVPMLPK